MRRALSIAALTAALALPVRATVDLTLYNSFPLLDSDGVTPLQGLAAYGDLVQLILVGPNGVIDPPDLAGNPGGDDTLYFTTHVGAGLTTTNTGLLVQSGILYPDSFVGTGAYVRFWNSNTVANASHYGNSMLFTLPAGDAFGLAEFDFVPTAGSPRITDTQSGGPAQAIPEPSQLFLLGLAILGGWWYRKHRAALRWVALLAAAVALAQPGPAQLPPPLDVTANAGIRNFDNTTPLPDGALVQLLGVGANGVADLPNPDGSPGGDDTVFATTVIGQGMKPELAGSGRFSTSFYPPPQQGAKVYARVFNAPSVAAATHWGQSATFTVHNVDVFDASALGLAATTQPKGSNPAATDTDGDGQTDFEELVANTNPLDPTERFELAGFVGSSVSVQGRAGRQYTLQRSTDELGPAMSWSDIVTSPVLNFDQNLVLSDPEPPATQKAFYRLKVTMP
jgi:hypothetical protein